MTHLLRIAVQHGHQDAQVAAVQGREAEMKTSIRQGQEGARFVTHATKSVRAIAIDAAFAFRMACGRRTYRPWLAVVAVPLAMTASGLMAGDSPPSLLTWPVLLGLAWWWYPGWRWGWLLSFEIGAFSLQWAALGAYSLADFPSHRLLVGVLWIMYAVLVGVVAAVTRRLGGAVGPGRQ